MSVLPQDRLQPSLLDRLLDHDRQVTQDSDEGRVLNKQQLRQSVLRDLSWLLNAVQSLSTDTARQYPQAAQSVLAYGLPPMAGQLASRIDIPTLERQLRQTVLRFEPRILADSLVVKAIEFNSVLDTHNVIEFEIRGWLWAQPIPMELLLRTRLDLEAGQVEVRETARSALPASTLNALGSPLPGQGHGGQGRGGYR